MPGFEYGERLVGNIFNKSRGIRADAAMDAYKGQLQMDRWTRQQLLTDGVGITVENDAIKYPSWIQTPQEAALAVQGYQKTVSAANKTLLDNIKTSQLIRDREMDSMFKMGDKFKGNPEAQKQVMNEFIIIGAQLYGKDIAKKINLEQIKDAYFAGKNIKSVWVDKAKEATWTALSKYQSKSGNTNENFLTYAKAFNAVPEDERAGMRKPENLATKIPTIEDQRRKNAILKESERIKKEVKAKGGASTLRTTKEMVLRKVFKSGSKSLTAGEREVWDLMHKPAIFRMMGEFEDEEPKGGPSKRQPGETVDAWRQRTGN